MADYQRARSPQQKAERMSAIMDATETLFAQLPYHEINMGLIAKELRYSITSIAPSRWPKLCVLLACRL